MIWKVAVKTISDIDRANRIGQLLVKGMYLFKESESRKITTATASPLPDLPAAENGVIYDDGLYSTISTDSDAHYLFGSQKASKEY